MTSLAPRRQNATRRARRLQRDATGGTVVAYRSTSHRCRAVISGRSSPGSTGSRESPAARAPARAIASPFVPAFAPHTRRARPAVSREVRAHSTIDSPSRSPSPAAARARARRSRVRPLTSEPSSSPADRRMSVVPAAQLARARGARDAQRLTPTLASSSNHAAHSTACSPRLATITPTTACLRHEHPHDRASDPRSPGHESAALRDSRSRRA